jgi:flagella basal body P-ring formation protein FlgA
MAATRPPSQAANTAQAGWSPSQSFRIAPPGRQTRPLLGVVAVLLILGCGAVGALLQLRSGERTDVIAVARTIQRGHRIIVDDLRRTRINLDAGIEAIPAAQADQVVGKVATTTLLPGMLVTPQALAAALTPPAGEAIVGLDLAGAQLPLPADQLEPGVQVQLVRTPPRESSQPVPGPDQQDSTTVLVDHADVYSVQPTPSGDSVHVAVVVDRAQAPAILRLAAAGQVGVAVVPAGEG